jgi:hypothetical protein
MAIPLHVRPPVALPIKRRRRHIGVVIPRHHADVSRRPQGVEPAARRFELRRQRDVDEVTGDGDVVGPGDVKVARDGVEHLGTMNAVAAALPIEVAEQSLRGELGQARPRQRDEMRIGQMRQHEHVAARPSMRRHRAYELPIRMPAANTSTPPTTTWNAAARNGVSM